MCLEVHDLGVSEMRDNDLDRTRELAQHGMTAECSCASLQLPFQGV
jgi:hypothetical protein